MNEVVRKAVGGMRVGYICRYVYMATTRKNDIFRSRPGIIPIISIFKYEKFFPGFFLEISQEYLLVATIVI
jgi:hypothetical protein